MVLLDREACLRLLQRTTFGRIAVTVGALPAVLPVNYRLVGEEIIFRTGNGTKLDAATNHAIVAFEIDEVDPISHAGWSVMVTGEARRITDPQLLAQIEDAGVPHWAHTDGAVVVAISTEVVTGRRIGLR
ncbi:MAG: pyridoxamine 5'-phosphate oxidase family protein [Actinomycetota bacterium]|jgi:nitroimidazol reductase NimA-like FMN-containing flavoprotein (pyridoxamine 5'-phosphate oxidase superfamily)|nr:pyridoxamine 5'-phosphate oxidase family protein [Actinomycetota bacterium]